MGIRLGNGFLDTRSRPVNADLDFPGLSLTLRPSFLGVGLVTRPGLAPTFLVPCLLGLLLLVWLPASVYLTGSHLWPGHPLVFLRGLHLLSQSLERGHLSGSGLSGGGSSRGSSLTFLEPFPDNHVVTEANWRAVGLV